MIGGTFARTNLPQPVGASTYNDANRLTQRDSASFTYDANGNLTSDGTNTYTWNARSELVSISGPSQSTTFQYDAFGRRVTKTVDGTSTTYLYDDFNVVRETTTSATVDILAFGLDQVFTRSDGTGSFGHLRDALGSTIALADFKRVFKSDGLTIDTLARAIAAYERTLLSGNSPFDRFVSGQRSAISEAQKRGWELFNGKAKCSDCHTYSTQNQFFTDFQFHNTGVAVADTLLDQLVERFERPSQEKSGTSLAHTAGFSELGRFAVTLQRADTGAFKTPTLRDLELTSPYMHDGSLKTLIDVVQFYNKGGNANSYLDKRMHPLQLTDGEVNDLVEFLRALTSDDVLRQCQTTTPSDAFGSSFKLSHKTVLFPLSH